MTKTLTMKNTKAEMLEAYEDLVNRLNAKSKEQITPEQVEKTKEEKRIVTSADELVSMNILNETVTGKYSDLKEAINLKEKELEELFEIKKEANSLVALINAHKEKDEELTKSFELKQIELQELIDSKKKEIDKEIAEYKAYAKKEKEKLNAEYEEYKEKLKKEREREEEEYQYELDRKKLRENNSWEEEKAEREKAIEQKEADLTEREAKVKSYEERILELEQIVEEKDNDLAIKLEENTLKVAKQCEEEFKVKEELKDKEHKCELTILQDKLSRAEATVEALKNDKADLTNKLDEAYSKIIDISSKAVQSNGTVKIVSNDKEK